MRLLVRPLPLAALLLALPVAAGVLPAASAAPPEGKGKPVKQSAPASSGTPRVVVADIDSGFNPYHEAFYAHGPSEVTPAVLTEFPGVRSVRLTRTGDLAADYAADKGFWDSVENGKPYWFEGTNLIGISFDTSAIKILADPGDEHGIGTSAAVVDANPEAIVVVAEGMGSPEAEAWAFNHPAVDIVTTSYGTPGSPPVPFHLENSYEGTVKRGKLHFGASDNSPALSPVDGTSGPWWSIAIAGFEEGTSEGRTTLSGNVVDFVADFTQDLPYCSDCESGRETVGGTSFATPRSAGTASKVLLETRRAVGHVGGPVVRPGAGSLTVLGGGVELTPFELRRALEEAAHYPGSGGYDPVEAAFDLGATPVVDEAPYVQTGWGLLTTDPELGVVDEALAQLGIRGQARAAKGGEACDVNTAQHEARHEYWDGLAIGSESFLTTDEDPFVHC